MKNAKKVLALLLAVVITLSMASCGKDPSVSNASSGDNSADNTKVADDNPYKDPMEIGIACWGIGDMIVDGEDAIRDEIYKKLNITIKPFPVTWGDYVEKIQVWAATQKLPDMTAYEAGYTDTFDKWTTQGVVRALPSDMSKYPNVKKLLDTPDGLAINKVKEGDANAKFYGVPRPSLLTEEEGLLDTGIAIRKDWMENVGVTKVPETLDEFIELLKLFQTADPDKNGKADTIGMCGYLFQYMSQVFSGTCPVAVNGFRWAFAEDGSLIPSFMTKDFLAGMKDLKKVYDAGVIDKDYIIYKGDDGKNKFLTGKAGAYAHGGPALGAMDLLKAGFKDTMSDKNFEDIIAYIPWFKNANGEIRYPTASMTWSETYLGSKVDDAKAERCMALLDYILSDEGYEQIGLGFEGKDFTKEADGKITLIETKNSDGTVKTMKDKYPASGLTVLGHWTGFRSLSSPVYSDGLKTIRNDYLKYHLDQGAKPVDRPNTNGLILKDAAEYDSAGSNYAKIVNELMTAKDIDAAFDKMVKDYMKNGYDKVIKEMNQLYKDSGR